MFLHLRVIPPWMQTPPKVGQTPLDEDFPVVGQTPLDADTPRFGQTPLG